MNKRIISMVLPVTLLVVMFLPTVSTVKVIAGILLALTILNMGRPTFFLIMANKANTKGSSEEVLKWFEKAEKTGRLKGQQMVTYAYFCLKNSKTDLAEELLNKVQKKYKSNTPDARLAKTYFSMVLWQREDLSGAICLLEELRAEGYKTSVLYGNLVFYYIKAGNLDLAAELNDEALEFNDDNTVILDNAGFLAYLNRDYDEALKIYDRLMVMEPGFPDAYYNYGLVLAALGRTEEGVSALEKALSFTFNGLTTIDRAEIESKLKAWSE